MSPTGSFNPDGFLKQQHLGKRSPEKRDLDDLRANKLAKAEHVEYLFSEMIKDSNLAKMHQARAS